jgi:hypothetical protein
MIGICRCLAIIFTASALLSSAQAKDNPVLARPTIVSEPVAVSGLDQAVISLDGAWKLAVNPQGEFWSNSADVSSWRDGLIPGGRGHCRVSK